MRNFKNIRVWQRADDLAMMIYSQLKVFPKEELYGLVSQLRRAAVSIPTNIAEGASRQHNKEYLNFLYIARGSLSEVEYLLHISRRLNYLEEKIYKRLDNVRIEIARMLYALINAVSKEVKF